MPDVTDSISRVQLAGMPASWRASIWPSLLLVSCVSCAP
jgi:hypothetical protein